jgi:hypothetical protein
MRCYVAWNLSINRIPETINNNSYSLISFGRSEVLIVIEHSEPFLLKRINNVSVAELIALSMFATEEISKNGIDFCRAKP